MQHVVIFFILFCFFFWYKYKKKFYSNTTEQRKYVNLGNLFGNVLIHTQNRMKRMVTEKKRLTQTKDCVYLKQIKIQEVQSAALFIPKK